MPASRAASGLPPMANVRRPNVVRFNRIQPSAPTTSRIHTRIGMPRSRFSAMLVMATFSTLTRWVRLPEISWARPRAATSIASVAMNAHHPPVRDEEPVDETGDRADHAAR